MFVCHWRVAGRVLAAVAAASTALAVVSTAGATSTVPHMAAAAVTQGWQFPVPGWSSTNKEAGRVDLHVYDDRGGVRAPASYNIQYWDGKDWRDARGQQKSPPVPAGGKNTVTFRPVRTQKVRVVFTHNGKARSGVSEIEVWRD